MKKPIFQTRPTARPKKSKPAPMVVVDAPDVTFGAQPDTKFNVSPAKLFAEPRMYMSRVKGLTDWFGTGACLLHESMANERMKDKGYYKPCKGELRQGNDDRVQELIAEALAPKPLRFVRKKVIKKQNDELKKVLSLGVYISGDDPRLFLVDMGLGPPPEVIYTGPTGDIVMMGVNAAEAKDVTYLVAMYAVEERFEKRLRKNLK